MKVLRWLERHTEEVFIVGITAVMLVSLFLQVLFRFCLNLSLGWTEELSINLMPWLCYFGCSLAVRERQHLRIEIITNFMPFVGKKVFDIIADLCYGAFSVIIIRYSWLLVANYLKRGGATAILSIPKWLVFVGIPITFILTVLRIVQDLVRISGELRQHRLEKKGDAQA